ncbi:hypothetical protein CH63R_07029 [Colletotrichum higginsianum IMI 349063]|uniref:Uncharacterized protein n=1 Tax=Colletotrichum higginsianum (strain IMI 349063) TaxID=759273 RepID=A0A1B7Y8D8_COLHI|nr:hypothetical protein CH63R_07029 [Colletotrichum higginsianum IMI 349063]OBR08264.1 hypothetical protein CH63R_07029 [Colletotrichum higginsianum IMI 349063]
MLPPALPLNDAGPGASPCFSPCPQSFRPKFALRRVVPWRSVSCYGKQQVVSSHVKIGHRQEPTMRFYQDLRTSDVPFLAPSQTSSPPEPGIPDDVLQAANTALTGHRIFLETILVARPTDCLDSHAVEGDDDDDDDDEDFGAGPWNNRLQGSEGRGRGSENRFAPGK